MVKCSQSMIHFSDTQLCFSHFPHNWKKISSVHSLKGKRLIFNHTLKRFQPAASKGWWHGRGAWWANTRRERCALLGHNSSDLSFLNRTCLLRASQLNNPHNASTFESLSVRIWNIEGHLDISYNILLWIFVSLTVCDTENMSHVVAEDLYFLLGKCLFRKLVHFKFGLLFELLSSLIFFILYKY